MRTFSICILLATSILIGNACGKDHNDKLSQRAAFRSWNGTQDYLEAGWHAYPTKPSS